MWLRRLTDNCVLEDVARRLLASGGRGKREAERRRNGWIDNGWRGIKEAVDAPESYCECTVHVLLYHELRSLFIFAYKK